MSTTVRFSKEDFEKVLDDVVLSSDALSWEERGHVLGEYRYKVIIKEIGSLHKVVAEIGSSVGADGFAKGTGQDSIRVWLTEDSGLPIGNKIQRWVTRLPGWENRFSDMLKKVIEIGNLVQFCTKCDSMRKIFIVKKDSPNKGRLFMKCNCSDSFAWLDEFEQTEEEDAVNGDSTPLCPVCGARMVRRTGKYGDFFGCSLFPACKGTRNIADEVQEEKDWTEEIQRREREEEEQRMRDKFEMERQLNETVKVRKPDKPKPSHYQLAVFDHIVKEQVHLVVEAVAGSGKTWTVVEVLKLFPRDAKIIYMAFNRHIVKELSKRVPRGARIGTYHSVGFKACRDVWGDIELVPDKVYHILEKRYQKDIYGAIFAPARQIVSLMKANLYDPDQEHFDYLTDRYGIELNGDRDLIYEAVVHVMARSMEMTTIIDYDDMVWLPVVHGLNIEKYDVVLVDEAQDTNRNQIELAKMMIKEGGKIVAVGDRHQSLYGFRGADVDAIPNLISELNADTLPLSITYRCPKAIVEEVNRRFPHIPFEAAEWADEGSIEALSYEMAMTMYHDKDMVLCRTNAPMVKPVFSLIRMGVKATIRGTDIGKGLVNLIEKMKADDVSDLILKLEDYKRKEVEKLMKAEKSSQAASVKDKVDTLVAISDGCYSIYEITDKIMSVFSDKVEGVVFSTVHRAKGLEADRVFILRPDLLPHPMARQEWELEQEENIEYVAVTRTLRELYWVHEE